MESYGYGGRAICHSSDSLDMITLKGCPGFDSWSLPSKPRNFTKRADGFIDLDPPEFTPAEDDDNGLLDAA